MVGCSSSQDDPPLPVSSSESDRDAALLRALEIDPGSEPIADERGGPASGSGAVADESAGADPNAGAPLDDFGEAILSDSPETLLDNPLFDDEEEEADITTLSVSPLITPGQLPDSEKASAIKRGPWKCVLQGKTVPGCVCKGSPLNCQVPNEQAGRNRYLPPAFAAEMKKRVDAVKAAGGEAHSPVDGGKWHVNEDAIVYDGAGKLRGRMARPGELPEDPTKPKNVCIGWADGTSLALATAPGECAKINFGGKKRITPEGGTPGTYVYAFNVLLALSSAPTGLDASGWIPLASVPAADQAALLEMPTVAGRRVTRSASFSATDYVVKSAKDWGQEPAKFAAAKLPTYAESKVAPGRAANKKVGDYLLKDGNVWNLAYNTPGIGGIGTDTFVVAHQSLGFRRVKSTAARPTLVRVHVYDNTAKPSILFAYGSVGSRFGWVALDAIKTGKVSTSPTAGLDGYCTGKPDGTYCNENASILGYVCRGGQVDHALRCAPPNTVCTGPSADGAELVCKP